MRQHIDLCYDDYFRLLRALVFAEIKRLRQFSDIFGDELRLSPQSAIGGETLAISAEEFDHLARRAGSFFGLQADSVTGLTTLGAWARALYELAGPRPATITFATSGSTGEPKSITRDYYSLTRDALYLAKMLVDRQRVLGLVPPHHIYGFIHTVLIPRALVVPFVDCRFQPPAALIEGMVAGDLVMGFPHIWRLCADAGLSFPARVVGMTSTGPCPAEVIHSLKQQGLAAMIEIYGSSENGAIGHRASPEDPLTLMETWRRQGDDHFVRELEDGGLSAPEAFQDALDWLDDKRFRVAKRLDSAVQVAGINVYPARVREVFLAHRQVRDCSVRLMRPDEGERLKAFVVLNEGVPAGDEVRQSIRRHLVGRLSRVEQPGSIIFGPELPKNEMGKLADWSVGRKTTGQ